MTTILIRDARYSPAVVTDAQVVEVPAFWLCDIAIDAPDGTRVSTERVSLPEDATEGNLFTAMKVLWTSVKDMDKVSASRPAKLRDFQRK